MPEEGKLTVLGNMCLNKHLVNLKTSTNRI